jgi:hypothetical protein
MVVKERIPEEHPGGGKLADAGAEAEEQLAFYLRRAFASDERVLVFNDLRILAADRNDFAQIDHLVLHPHGFVLVESKSVTGSVEINEHGEWCRVSGQRRNGMHSPVVQARMQGDVLRQVLNAEFMRAERPAGAAAHPFDKVPFDVLVAISDRGIIKRRCEAREVHKADVIPLRIAERIARLEAEAVAAQGPGAKPVFGGTARRLISEFLLSRHTPLRRKSPGKPVEMRREHPRIASDIRRSPPSMMAPPPKAKHGAATDQHKRCRFCSTGALHLQHGRYGYYFRCITCTRNTPIDFTCTGCGQKARIRKEGEKFFKECGECGRASLFYVNASLKDLEDPSRGEAV